jgi:hypothetical protein
MSLQGSQRVAVLLCKFGDSVNVEPHPQSFYKDLVVNRGTGGVNDYWIAASLGAINLDGSAVFGWKTLEASRADFLAAHPGRWDKIQGAMKLFKTVNFSEFGCVIVFFNVDPGDGGFEGGILGKPWNANVTFLAHELGHFFGIEHSFDRSERQLPDAQKGEYFDRFDIMSAMNVEGDSGHRFSPRGPLLNVANLARMGWLPQDRVWRPGKKNSSGVYDVDIVALEHPEAGGYLAAEAGGWIAEFRIPGGFDAGFDRPAVLFHEYPANPNSFIVASDRASRNHQWLPGQTHWDPVMFERFGGTKATVVAFDFEKKSARLRVRTKAVRAPFLPLVDLKTYFSLGIGQLPIDGVLLVLKDGRIVPIPVPEPGPDPILPVLDRGSLEQLLRLSLPRE